MAGHSHVFMMWCSIFCWCALAHKLRRTWMGNVGLVPGAETAARLLDACHQLEPSTSSRCLGVIFEGQRYFCLYNRRRAFRCTQLVLHDCL